jgi:uncharacterized glyoxalase superfamily protein PhnB
LSYKPEGYPSVSPYLVVEDGQRLIAFLEEVFEATVKRSFARPDGSLGHAELAIDDSVVMVGEATGEWKPSPSMVHVYVRDVDTVWKRAMQAGATVQQEPSRQPDGDTRGGFAGPCGNSWWISTQPES